MESKYRMKVNDIPQFWAGENIQKQFSLFDSQEHQIKNVNEFCFLIWNIYFFCDNLQKTFARFLRTN